MNWTAVQSAIQAWAVAGTGLPGTKVVWRDQATAASPAPRPAPPFVDIHLGPVATLGARDEVRTSYDPAGPPGQEIVQRVKGQREFVIVFRSFAPSVLGAASARALLTGIQTALALPQVDFDLREVVSVFTVGQVTPVPAILDTETEARATLEARAYIVDELEERTTYIERAEVEDLTTGDKFLAPKP